MNKSKLGQPPCPHSPLHTSLAHMILLGMPWCGPSVCSSWCYGCDRNVITKDSHFERSQKIRYLRVFEATDIGIFVVQRVQTKMLENHHERARKRVNVPHATERRITPMRVEPPPVRALNANHEALAGNDQLVPDLGYLSDRSFGDANNVAVNPH